MKNKKLMFESEDEEVMETNPALEDEIFDLRSGGRSKDYLIKLLMERGFNNEDAIEIVNSVDENVKSYKISNAKLMIIAGCFILPIGIFLLLFSDVRWKFNFSVLIVGGLLMGKGLNTIFYYKNEKDQKTKPYWKRD